MKAYPLNYNFADYVEPTIVSGEGYHPQGVAIPFAVVAIAVANFFLIANASTAANGIVTANVNGGANVNMIANVNMSYNANVNIS